MRATAGTDELRGWDFVNEATGKHTVYPGHPLVLAYEIMRVFPDVDSALDSSQTVAACPAAVADNRISGGGGQVHIACDILRRAKNGEPVEALVAWADEVWVTGSAGGHTKAVEPGLAQAQQLKAEFPAQLAKWLAA